MTTLMERLRDAVNSHDAQQMAALVAADYESVQPIHPNRAFGGRSQVLENWSSVFAGVPDIAADLLASCADGPTEWGEWHWHGHYQDGSRFAMRGVTILRAREGLVAEMRLYLEPVEAGGGDIDEAVEQLYKPPPQPSQ